MPKVYISPSVQENNIGTGDYGTEESNMQVIGAELEKLLQYNGIQTKRNRPDMTLQQIVAESNKYNPDIHVAIHSNAGGGRGCEVYRYKGSAYAEKLAKFVYAEISAITPSLDRGIKDGNHLYELRNTKAPAVLVEIAFHDNLEDAYWLRANIKPIAEALAKAVCKYFNFVFKKPEQKLYRVQVGAFAEKENAEQLADRLKKLGLNAIIKYQ